MGEIAIKKNPQRWIAVLVVFLFYFLVLGFTNQAFSVLLATMAKDMKWTGVQTTAIATAMFGGMVWFVFIAGSLLDKFSAKKIMLATGAVVGIVFFLRGYAQDFSMFFALMFIYGIASAFYIPTCTKLISLWFDTKEIALANGMLTSASPAGQLVANLFGYQIAMTFGGWRSLWMVCGVATIVLIVFIFFILKERTSLQAELKSEILKTEDLTFWRNIAGVAKSPLVWIYALANATLLGTVYAMMTYQNYVFQLDPKWGLSAAVSGTIPAFSNFASMIGYTLVPFILMKLKWQKHYGVISVIAGLIATTAPLIGYYLYDVTYMRISFAIFGAMCGAALTAPKVFMLQLPEVSGPRAGTAMGLYITVERIAVTILVAVIGGFITKSPVGSSIVLAQGTMLMYLSPILLIAGILITKNRLKKNALKDAIVTNE